MAPPLPPEIAMYGNHENDANYENNWCSMASDVANFLGLYSPQIDFSAGRGLTSELIGFFSISPGENYISQQFRKICQIKGLYGALEEKPKDALLCMTASVHKVLFMKWDIKKPEEFAKITLIP